MSIPLEEPIRTGDPLDAPARSQFVRSLARYGVAAVLVAAAVGLKLAVGPLSGAATPFLVLHLSVMLAAWLGGVGPGLFATGLALLGSRFLLGRFSDLESPAAAAGFLPLALFAVEGCVSAGMIGALRRARLRERAERMRALLGEERQRSLLEATHEGLWTADTDGRIVEVGGQLSRILGYPSEELVGRRLEEFQAENDPTSAEDSGGLGDAWQGVVRFVARDGSTVWALLSRSELTDASGRPAGVMGALTVVTDRVRTLQERERSLERERISRLMAEQGERQYRQLAEAIPAIVWSTDSAGLTDYCNSRWYEYTGLGLEQTRGDGWAHVIHPDDVPACLQAWERSSRDLRPFEAEYRVRRASDSAFRWHFGRAVPLLDRSGRLVRWFGCALDIHDQKRAVASLELLARVGDLLAGPLDLDARLSCLAGLIVPALADRINIDLIDSDERVRRLRQASGEGELLEDPGRSPVELARLDEEVGPGLVFRTGQPAHHEAVDARLLAAIGLERPAAGPVEAGEVRSVLMVPLLARGRVIGVATLMMTDRSGRGFGGGDVALAEELAGRAGLAIENARLYAEVRDALASKDEALARLDSIFATAPVGLAFFDREGRFARVNRALCDLVCKPAGDLLGRTCSELELEATDHFNRLIRDVAEHCEGSTEEEVRFETHGQAGDWLVRCFPLPISPAERSGVGIVVVDITERKRVEREVRTAKEAAESANRTKDQFLAVLSHELRTPLTPVLAAVSALMEDPGVPPELRSTLAMIRRNVELEARLIEDLLDVTKISKGLIQLHPEPCDLHSLARRVLEICYDQIESAGLHVELELRAGRARLVADPARLTQVIWNLVKNAVKFTPSGGSVRLRSSDAVSASGEPVVVLEVADTGHGIDPERIGRIFDQFVQGEETTNRKFGGLGLGLSISRWLVEAQGGRLSASSPGLGMGATFRVEMPVAPAPAAGLSDPVPTPTPQTQPVPPSPAKPTPTAATRLLLVEDDPDTLRVLSSLLRRRGFEVTPAASMAEATRLGLAEPFDLVVSDIGLPDGSGHDMMRRLRAHREFPGIALSGFGTEEDIRRSRDAGFAEHLIKPVSFPDLERAIHRLVAAGTA